MNGHRSTNGAARADVLAVALVVALAAATAPAQRTRGAKDPEANLWNCTGDPNLLPTADPSGGEVPLPKAHADWNAFHLFTSDTWRLHAIGAGHVTRPDGPPEVIFMDEIGRTILLTGDSGKYAPRVLVEDTAPMSAWALGDLDPRVPGMELYLGGGSGRLFRANAAPRRHRGGASGASGAAEAPPSEVVGFADGAVLSKFVLGDLDPRHPGNEMLALTNNGPVYDVRPDAGSDAGFVLERIGDLGSRCRDALLLPATAHQPARVAALLESGEVTLLVRNERGYAQSSLCHEPMSIARMDRRPPVAGELEVVYVARIDGLIVRFAEQPDGRWHREPIYAGPNGPRGLAAGRFDVDPASETLAVFGYSKKVQLLRKQPGSSWAVETIYVDTGGGHWLAAGELDGRNTTDELVGGGFSYHVFLLARVPGAGFQGIAVDPDRGIPDYPLPEHALRFPIGSPVAANAHHGGALHALLPSPLKTGVPDGAVLAADFEHDAAGSVPKGFAIAESNGAGSPAVWQVVAGAAADGTQRVAITATKNGGQVYNLLLADAAAPADLELEVAVRAEHGKEDQGGGLVWRAQSAADYYLARWNPLENNVRAYRVVDGERTMLDSAILQCDTTRWHRLTVVMRGTKATVSFDGTRCLSFEDTAFAKAGKVGLWSKADAATSFDGLLVQRLDDGGAGNVR